MRFGVVLPIQDTQAPLDVLLDQLRAEVRAADAAGFDAFFLPEFHQTRAGGVISPLLTGAALAEGTRRIRVGQAVVPGPLYHPVRYAVRPGPGPARRRRRGLGRGAVRRQGPARPVEGARNTGAVR